MTADEIEPGAPSQPEGDGPVSLADRTEPGGQGSPDTNQAKTEPVSPTPDHPEPAVDLPTLGEMNVGSADPQSPSHPAALAPPTRPGGAGPQELSAAGSGGDGTAQRAPGSLGATPTGEAFGVDTDAGAARLAPTGGPGDRSGRASGHGDTGPAPSSGDAPLDGSSQEQAIVTGARLPEVDEG